MSRDGRNDDDADWLLAQLANGQQPARQEPPVAPPAFPVPPADAGVPEKRVAPVPPPAFGAPVAPQPPAPRREEVLDWFSLAEPPAAPDAATRALPVIGGPLAPSQGTPAVPQVPAHPVEHAPAPAEPTGGYPSWNPPFTVGRPDQPAAPASSPLTSVEPPVGSVPPTFAGAGTVAPVPPVALPVPPVPPAAAAPVPPAATPVPPAAAAPPPPPGPVTPTAPFALTWGSSDLDNEDALRAAFRSLSEPEAAAAAADSSTAAAAPAVSPTVPAQAPEPAADSPFAGYAPPPVARQSFTPVPTGPTAVPPTDPPSFAPAPSSFTPTDPPRHPIAPSTAPAGWDERAASPTPPSAPLGTPAIPPGPATSGAPAVPAAGFDAELWSALTAPDEPAPSASPAQPTATTPPAPWTPMVPSTAAPAAPTAPASGLAREATAAVDPTPTERFTAFAAETVDPFSALFADGAKTQSPVAHSAQAAERPAAASGPPAPRPEANAADSQTPVGGTGFPFIEVRGAADTPISETAGIRAEAVASRRPPFPAFASARDDEPQRPPQTGEPVDDLLAALGSGSGAGRSRDDDRGDADVPADAFGSGTPARGGTPPPGDDDPLGALGLGFDGDDDDADDADEPEAPRAPRGRFFGRDRSLDDEDDADAERIDGEPDDGSPIARELAETGYFWNLTPDPSAPDPKADPERDANGLERPLPFAAAGFDADAADEVDHAVEVDDATAVSDGEPADDVPLAPFWTQPASSHTELEQGAEPDADAEPEAASEPEWSFGDDAPTAAYRTDDATAAYRPDDAATARFPHAGEPTSPAASATHDADPLAALFGGAAAAAAPTDPWSPAAAATAASAAPVRPQPAPAQAGPSAMPRATSTQTGGASGGGSGSRGSGSGGSGNSGSTGDKRTVRTLIWVAGGLAVLLVLAGLFYVGTLLSGGGSGGAADAASPSATPSATETPVAAPTGPQPAGVHAWNTLFGGECVDPYVDPWAAEFTVVDCAAPHAAQLVSRGTLPGDAAAPFPGEAELGSQMGLLCTADGVIDQAAISGITDLQVQAAFPVEEQWAAGERTYYCFANRSGGEPLTGSIAGPGPAA